MDRALSVLQAFRSGDRQLSATELLRRVPLSRPTLYRLLHTLERNGYVVAAGEPQRFSLGPAVARLAHVWTSSLDLPTLARPMMQQLWEETGETVALMLHSGESRVCVAEMPSPQPLSFKRGVGHSERVTVGASGRVILAWLDDPLPFIDDLAPRVRPAYLRQLAQIRDDGYAVSREELIKGAVAIAVPVFLGGGQVTGSLVVYGPSVRIDEPQIRRIARLLVRQSQRISLKAGAG